MRRRSMEGCGDHAMHEPRGQDRCGVADPRVRPYWRPTQKDLNTGKPETFRPFLPRAMYRIIDNADGVWNINSDPASAPQSGKRLRQGFAGCRTLIDRYITDGKQTKLVNWMLWGWGRPRAGANRGPPQSVIALPARFEAGIAGTTLVDFRGVSRQLADVSPRRTHLEDRVFALWDH